MQFNKSLLALLLIPSILISCTKEDDSTSPSTPDPVEPAVVEQGYLVRVLDSAGYTLSDFGNAVSNSAMVNYADQFVEGSTSVLKPAIQALVKARKPALDALFLARVGLDRNMHSQYRIESYIFSFNTHSASGQPIVLSGRVTFPNNTVASKSHAVDSYTLFSHQYVMAADWVPSECLSMMSLRALYNSAVIEPDAQGYGVTLNQESVAFLSYDTRARQLADCVRAARELMQQHNVCLATSGYTTNWGSSLGAPVALAFARYYDLAADNNLRRSLRLKSSYVGEGPLDYAAMLLYMDDHPTYHASVSSAFYGLDALTPDQMYGYTAADFLPKWMDTVRVPWEGSEYSYLHAASHVMAGYNRYSKRIRPDTLFVNTLAADMTFDNLHLNLQSPKTQALLQVLREQGDWSGWQTQHDIYMAHAQEDDNIPYATVRNIYNQLRQQAGSQKDRIHWLEVDTEHDIATNDLKLGPHYGPSIEAMLLMALAYEPKDMARFYKEQ
ncbi:MAG: hypothetical protein IJ620_06025 [Bacteroidales bacterium]|nr:hypothetical protein [Bacteroidales bacterium]